MTPEEVAAKAMQRAVEEIAFAGDCWRHGVFGEHGDRCQECPQCLRRMVATKELHRLGALYPKSVPKNAPAAVLAAVKRM